MIYKTEKKENKVMEVIYSETGAEYDKRRIEFTIGELLNELLEFDFDKFNIYIKSNMDLICSKGFLNLEDFEKFRNLSDNTKFLIIYTTDIRFLLQRYRNRKYDRSKNYFQPVIKTLTFIKKAIENSLDSEDYFRFYFKFYLDILTPESLYESKHDLNILNYVFPVAYAYINSSENNGKTTIELEQLLNMAENNKDYITKLIDFVPQGNPYREIMNMIKKIYWIDELGRYRSIPIPFKKIIDEFSTHPLLQQLFLQSIYEYSTLHYDKSFAFKTLEEYLALCVLECYKNGCPICKCPECGKLFVRLTNSRRLCGNKQCITNNKRKSALQRKQSFGNTDANAVFSNLYKALCYSKSKFNEEAYINADDCLDEIKSKQISKQIVYFLKEDISSQYKKDNKLYKSRISKLADAEKELPLKTYKDWLNQIKTIYKHQYVVNAYRKSFYYNTNSKTPFIIEYFKINDDFSEIITIYKEIHLEMDNQSS